MQLGGFSGVQFSHMGGPQRPDSPYEQALLVRFYEGLTCDALEWQYSHGGGQIINPESLEVELNNQQTIATFERAAGWVGGISPKAVTGYKEEDARAVWQDGNAAFMRNWPYAYSLGQDEGLVIEDKFTVGQLPSGDGETHAATLGGWQMFVSQYSQNQEVAKEFARFVCSAPIQQSRGCRPSARSTRIRTCSRRNPTTSCCSMSSPVGPCRGRPRLPGISTTRFLLPTSRV